MGCDTKMDFESVVDLLASREGPWFMELIKGKHVLIYLTAAQHIYSWDMRY